MTLKAKSLYEKLDHQVIVWAKKKGILEKATPMTQFGKTDEEVEELREALIAQKNGEETFVNHKGETVNTKAEIIDSIGDIAVTLIIQCEMQGVKFVDCLEAAYEVIKNRKGKMVEGVFIREK